MEKNKFYVESLIVCTDCGTNNELFSCLRKSDYSVVDYEYSVLCRTCLTARNLSTDDTEYLDNLRDM